MKGIQSFAALLGLVLVALGWTDLALACPLCHSDVAALVRKGLRTSLLDPRNGLAVLGTFLIVIPILFVRGPDSKGSTSAKFEDIK